MPKKLNAIQIEFVKTFAYILAGALLAFQPFVLFGRILGWFLLLTGAVILAAMLVKTRKAKKILQDEIARFDDGSIFCRQGVYTGGELINLGTFGTSPTGLDFTGESLVLCFRYVARGNRRKQDQVIVRVAAHEREKALLVIKEYGLPAISSQEDPPDVDPHDMLPT